MIELDLKKLKEAGLKAYREKRLSAQGPTPACKYRDDSGHPCVIGVSLTDDEAAACDDEDMESVSILYHKGVMAFSSEEEMHAARRLQALHDRWAEMVKAGRVADAANFEKALFIALGGSNDEATSKGKKADN